MKEKQIIKCAICGYEEFVNRKEFKYFKPERYDIITTYIWGCSHCDDDDETELPF